MMSGGTGGGDVSLAFGGVSWVCLLPSRYEYSGFLLSVVLRSWFGVGDTSADVSVVVADFLLALWSWVGGLSRS